MRTLTITTNDSWKDFLLSASKTVKKAVETQKYQGERLNFATPGAFFSHLTERRWNLLNELIGDGTVGVRELARRLHRDVKRVHEDAAVLVDMGLLEKDEKGALFCPYDEIHVDMLMSTKKVA